MSKYGSLTDHLNMEKYDEWRASFAEIEGVLGFSLPAAARKHRAWWSNNGSNNVMTTAWLEAGWRSEQVDMAREKLVFRRSSEGSGARPVPAGGGSVSSSAPVPSLVGALRGTVRIHIVIESAAEGWSAEAT